MSLVDFAIVGVPKSATTFIHYTVRTHPDVFMQENEDVTFLQEDWAERIPSFLAGATASRRRVAGMKRPDLLFSPDAARRMKSHNPAIKTIAVLRHPVERLVAHYFHLMGYCYIPLRDFDTGMRSLISGEMQKEWWRSFEVFAFSHYREAIERFAEIIGPENLHVVLHDDVKADAPTVARAVCGFLGLDFEGKVTFPSGRPQKVVYSLDRLRFLRHRNEATMQLDEFGRAIKVTSRALTPQERAWEMVVKQFDEKVIAPISDNAPPRLSTELWEKIYPQFRDDILYVERLLGRELPTWHANPLAA